MARASEVESGNRFARRRAARLSASTSPRTSPAKHLDWLIAAGLVLLTAVVYVQVAGFEFTNYDDTAYVPDNAHVRDGFSLERRRLGLHDLRDGQLVSAHVALADARLPALRPAAPAGITR